MNNCPYCGTPVPDGSLRCPGCGVSIRQPERPASPAFPEAPAAPMPPVPYDPAGQSIVSGAASPAPDADRAFREMRMHLHQESKAWRFTAIGMLVVLLSVVGFLLSVGGIAGLSIRSMDSDFEEAGFLLIFFGLYCMIFALMFAPIIIMGFVMGKKVMDYYNESARDCTRALKHVGSVGLIVLGAFFSTPAMIFIIINFAKYKKHREELEAVLARQKAAGGASFHG